MLGVRGGKWAFIWLSSKPLLTHKATPHIVQTDEGPLCGEGRLDVWDQILCDSQRLLLRRLVDLRVQWERLRY